MNNQDLGPDSELSEKQTKAVQKLTPTQVEHIDGVLLNNTDDNWRKIARVVGSSMLELSLIHI